MTLQISMIGGNCPVQAEGTIDGKPFYFRARGMRWTMGVGGDPLGHPTDPSMERPDWYAECTWGDVPFAAGWMSEAEARRLIEWCASEYVANASRNAPEAPPAADLHPKATGHAPEGETSASGLKIGSARDAGNGGAA